MVFAPWFWLILIAATKVIDGVLSEFPARITAALSPVLAASNRKRNRGDRKKSNKGKSSHGDDDEEKDASYTEDKTRDRSRSRPTKCVLSLVYGAMCLIVLVRVLSAGSWCLCSSIFFLATQHGRTSHCHTGRPRWHPNSHRP